MITMAAFVAAAILTLAALGGLDLWHHIKRGAHRAGCAVERVVGKRCAPAKPRADAGKEWPFDFNPVVLPESACVLLARKLELQVKLAVAPTPELRAEYAWVQAAWNQVENAAMGIR